MDWEEVEDNWQRYRGKAKERWSNLTDDDLDVIDGRPRHLVRKLRERYGTPEEIAEQQAEAFLKALQSDAKLDSKSNVPSAPGR